MRAGPMILWFWKLTMEEVKRVILQKFFLVPCRRQTAPRMEEEHERFLLVQTSVIKMKIKT